MNEHDQARVFFRALFEPGDVIELRPIDASGEADVARGKAWPETVEEAVSLASEHSSQGWNAYYGVYPRVAPNIAKSGNDSVAAMTSAWVEIDWQKIVPGGEDAIRSGARTLEGVLDEGRRIADGIISALPVPTLVVASGAGYHVYWMLRERLALVTDEARAKAQALLEAANVRCSADKGVKDLARVLRVPGTTNFPNHKKRALGRGPVPTTLLHVRDDARYGVDELVRVFAPPPTQTSTNEGSSGTPLPPPSPRPSALESDYEILHRNAKLLKIWNGHALDGDRSRRDSRFALTALRDGVPEPVVGRLLASMPGGKAASRNGRYVESVLSWARTEAGRAPITTTESPIITTAPSVEPWDAPISLDQRNEVEPFPVETLPEPFRAYVLALAAYTSTPVDMAGGLVLVAIATAVLGKFSVIGRWREPLNIFFSAIASPGERKSPVFRCVFRSIREFEAALRAARAPEIERERALRRALEKRRERAEKDLADAVGADDRSEAERALGEVVEDLARHPEPVEPRLLVDDATPEALTRMLAEHGGMGLLSTEGGVFAQMCGRYAKRGGANLDVYNKAYDGDPIVVDRVGGGVLRAESPNLIIGVTVQPGLVRDLSRESALRELGLLGRFLFAWPKSLVGYREDGPPVPADLERCYAQALGALLAIPRDNHETLTLSPEAANVFDAFRTEIEHDLRPTGKSADMADWANKLAGKVLRVMALLHLAAAAAGGGPRSTVIGASVAADAVHLGRYYTTHARAVFGLLGTDNAVENAQVVLEKIRQAGARTMKRSDLYEIAPGRFKRAADLNAALALLADRRVIRPVEAPGNGRGRPATTYNVNPFVFATTNTRQNEKGNGGKSEGA